MTKEAHIPIYMEEYINFLKQFKFPGSDIGNFIQTYQKNLELMNAAQEIAVETTNTMMGLQRRYMKKTFDQLNDQIKNCCSKAPLNEKTAYSSEAAKATVRQTIEHIQELNSLIAQSNEKLNASIQKRFKENFEEQHHESPKHKETKDNNKAY